MKFKLFLFASIVAISFASCKVSLVPTRSQDAITAVQNAAIATDNLYSDIIGSTEKDYATYATNYEIVNKQITEIIIMDSERKKSGVILIIAQDIHKRFQKYQEEHRQAGTINNSQARTYKDYMHALFSSLLNAENNFK